MAGMGDSRLSVPVHTHTLSNGLKVQVSPDPNAASTAVNLWYRVGSGEEKPGATGFAHLFEHLMFQGSQQVSSGEHLTQIQAIGGECNATTSFDRTNYFETVPPTALELALWLESDRLSSLKVNQENLDNQREVVKEEKRQRYDNVPYGDMLRLLLELNFPAAHPYGHPTIGSMDDLDAASLDDVRAFFDRWYRPDGLVLSIAGPVKPEEGFELVEKYFGHLEAGNVPSQTRPKRLDKHSGHPVQRVSRDVPRDAVILTWRTPACTHEDAPAVQLALDVLASGESSRLVRKLVRDEQIAEYVSGADFDLVRGTSMAMISAGAPLGINTDALAEKMLNDVSEIIENGPTEKELSRVMANLEHSALALLGTVSGKADELGEAATIYGDPEHVNTQLPKLLSITPEQISDASAKWLSPENVAELHYERQD